MRRTSPIRGLRPALAVALSLVFGAAFASAQYRHEYRDAQRGYGEFSPQLRQAPAPIERRPPPEQQNSRPGDRYNSGHRSQALRSTRGEHLAQWMNQHSNLTPDQQQRALEREPGFQQLPHQTQQRMRERLSQLDAMPPDVRQRLLSHTEVMEHMTIDQRAEVRGAMQQLGSLPLDQRRAVAHSFRELRMLPPNQRAAVANSQQYGWMSPAQRATLNNLLRVEPLLPPSGR